MPSERLAWWLWRRWTLARRSPGSWVHLTAFVSRDSALEGNNYLYAESRVHASTLGRRTYLARGASAGHAAIGRYCSIGPGARIGGLGAHPTTMLSTHPVFYSTLGQSGPSFATVSAFDENPTTTLGHDVWVGAGAIVIDGMSVGDGAVVAAGAVVAHQVAPYAIVGGVPARHIRFRFAPDVIDALHALSWWDLDEETLSTLAAEFATQRDWSAQDVGGIGERGRNAGTRRGRPSPLRNARRHDIG